MRLGHSNLIKRAKKIRLLAMDVDGVLTGGEVILLHSGEEVKIWNAKDRLGLALVRDEVPSLKIAWITGRKSKAVSNARRDLGIHFVVQGCMDKRKALTQILKSKRISLDQTAYIGDDLIDLSVIKDVGLSACPSDAVREIKNAVHYISRLSGGKGAVRDVLELILKAQRKWKPVIHSLYF